jgi:hypothetical protein
LAPSVLSWAREGLLLTAQVSEALHYRGDDLALCTEPLEGYFALTGERPPFEAPHTALWRGYVGQWEILDDRLYLTGLTGCGKNGQDIGLPQLFPDYSSRVFAHWVNGTLRATRGKCLQYVHAGFASVYEQDVFFHFDNGILMSVEVIDNSAPANPAFD